MALVRSDLCKTTIVLVIWKMTQSMSPVLCIERHHRFRGQILKELSDSSMLSLKTGTTSYCLEREEKVCKGLQEDVKVVGLQEIEPKVQPLLLQGFIYVYGDKVH